MDLGSMLVWAQAEYGDGYGHLWVMQPRLPAWVSWKRAGRFDVSIAGSWPIPPKAVDVGLTFWSEEVGGRKLTPRMPVRLDTPLDEALPGDHFHLVKFTLSYERLNGVEAWEVV